MASKLIMIDYGYLLLHFFSLCFSVPEEIYGFPIVSHLSVCPSVHHKLCFLCNFKSIQDIFMKCSTLKSIIRKCAERRNCNSICIFMELCPFLIVWKPCM